MRGSKRTDMFKLTDVAKQLVTLDVILSGDKTAHVRFGQSEGGLRVENSVIGVHFRDDGSIGAINSSLAFDAKKAVGSPAINEAQAIATAESALKTEVPTYSKASLAQPPAPKLVLNAQGATAVLAWRFHLAGKTNAGGRSSFGRSFLIDARTSAIVESFSSIHDAMATGLGVKKDEKTFEVSRRFLVAGDYQLTRGGILSTGITTFDANQANAIVSSPNLEGPWDQVATGAGAAVDGHTYVIGADGYFRSYHGWGSYNGRGGSIKVFAHDNSMVNNAWWDGTDGLHFSDGNLHTGGTQLPRSAGPDTVGHEFMHGVTQHTANLAYQGQSGALNESISDIFGSYVEAEIHPGSQYEHGDQNGVVLRDLAHPTAKGQPDNMRNLAFAGQAPAANNDWAGVHSNSGIPNNAWYLMSNGGENDTSKIPVLQSIGTDSARNLWWATVRYFLSSGSQFDRAARWQTAWALITGRPIEAVGCAWVATGVLTNKYILDTYKVRCYCELPDGGVQQPEQMQCCKQGKEDECCKPCDEAGASTASDGGAPSKPNGDPRQPDLYDSCTGRADGVYCSQLASYSAIVCQGEQIALGIQCENERKCIGPNGPGTQVQCEGGANIPSAPAPDGGSVPIADSCEGRPDGVYCSSLAPYSAYECQGGTIAGGQQCEEGKTCKGPNGPGKLVCQ